MPALPKTAAEIRKAGYFVHMAFAFRRCLALMQAQKGDPPRLLPRCPVYKAVCRHPSVLSLMFSSQRRPAPPLPGLQLLGPGHHPPEPVARVPWPSTEKSSQEACGGRPPQRAAGGGVGAAAEQHGRYSSAASSGADDAAGRGGRGRGRKRNEAEPGREGAGGGTREGGSQGEALPVLQGRGGQGRVLWKEAIRKTGVTAGEWSDRLSRLISLEDTTE
jgi:hypothetical protein